MNKYVCHPSGNDLNGGGYDLSLYVGTWAQWHDDFDALSVQTGLTVSENGGGVRITGTFSSSYLGVIVYCNFAAVYPDGRYAITEASDTYIELALPFTDLDSVNVRVGGAILSPKQACDLGNGTDGHEVLFPCNQTNGTIHEVDGTANNITMATEGATLNIYGVDEATGVLLTTDDSNDWPAIKAKDGSSWTANTGMFTSTATLCYSKVDKILFDGNSLVLRVLYFGDGSTDHVQVSWGGVFVKNSKSDGYGVYANGYLDPLSTVSGINTLRIDNCHFGVFAGRPISCRIRSYLWLSNCDYGVYDNANNLDYVLLYANGIIYSGNDVGLYRRRTNAVSTTRMTFINNAIDVQLYKYSTEAAKTSIQNCLFYNSGVGGKIIDSDDNGTYLSCELVNCVLGNVTNGSDTSRFSGITPTRIDCEYIQANPFMDSATGDLRLNPAFADLAKIFDFNKQVNNIGATSMAEPAAGGGSVFKGINDNTLIRAIQ